MRTSRGAAGLGLGFLVGIGVLFLDKWGTFEKLELATVDAHFWNRYDADRSLRAPGDVVVVELNDKTRQSWKRRSPIPRDYLAQLIRSLNAAKPKIIFLDVLLHEPTTEDEDRQLAAALAEAKNVILAHDFFENLAGMGGPLWPLERFREGAAGVGFVRAPMDVDGTYRRTRLARIVDGKLMLSADAVIWARLHNLTDERVQASLSQFGTLPDSDFHFDKVTTMRGETNFDTLIDFSAPPRLGFACFLAHEVVAGKVSAEKLRGKVVMIGAHIPYLGDTFKTPFFQRLHHQQPAPMVGIEIRAHAVNTLLEQRFIQPVSRGTRLLVILLFATATGGLLGFMRFRYGVVIVALLTWAVWWMSDWQFTHHSVRFDSIGPMAAMLLAFLAMGYRLLQNEVVNRRLEAERAESEREQLQRLAEGKSRVLNTIVHDLKVPITIIKADALTLLHDRAGMLDDSIREEFLETISQQCDRLTREIDDLLDTDPESEVRLQIGEVDVRQLVENVVGTQGGHARVHTFSIECAADLPAIRADKYKLTRVLNNLVNNAIKYSPAGGEVKVAVTASRMQGAADGSDAQLIIRADSDAARNDHFQPNCLLIAVTDHGLGMTQDQQAKLFGLFSRVHEDHTIPGTGVGLFSTKRLIEAHGGSVWVESEQGTGSTFYFTVPMRTRG